MDSDSLPNLADDLIFLLREEDPSLTRAEIARRFGATDKALYDAARAREVPLSTVAAWIERWNAGGHQPQLQLVPAQVLVVPGADQDD